MEQILLIIGILILLALGVVIYLLLRPKTEKAEGMVLLQQQLQDMTRTMDERLGESNKAMQAGSRAQFKDSKELMQEISREVNEQIRDVIKNVTEVKESSKQVFQVADQLKELQERYKCTC